MNAEHCDIQKIIPYGEQLRGFVNQKFISPAELTSILRERGVIVLNSDKDFTVPLLQTLLLTPREFDRIRDAFSVKEDNKKVISRDIKWGEDIRLFSNDTLQIDVDDFIKRKLPTCSLLRPIRLIQVDNNPNHLKAEFTIKRLDLNKSWYEQTNEFIGAIEFINENNGKGRVIISHTAPETKELAEYAVKEQIKTYKKKGFIEAKEELRRILFSDFSNDERFVFFFRLTNHLESVYFKCENIKDVSIKPDEMTLPEEIKWMEDVNKILLSGRYLDNKFFIKEKKYHKSLILWSVDCLFQYNYKGQKGLLTVNFGFPDYPISKKDDVEFEINISSIKPEDAIDAKTRKQLRSQLLSEMDRQKSIVFNKFLEYKTNN